MPTDKDLQDLPPQAPAEVPTDHDLNLLNETPAEADPAGSKEADALSDGPEISIDPPAEELSDADKKEDRGTDPAPEASPGSETQPGSDEPLDDTGAKHDDADAAAEPTIPAEPSANDLEFDGSGVGTDLGSLGTNSGADPESASAGGGPGDPDPQPADADIADSDGAPAAGDQTDGEPQILEPALDPEVEPSLELEEPKADAETEGAYKGFQAGKEGIAAALGSEGSERLLKAANSSFALVELLREVANEAAEAERQEAQFLLGIGSLWLAQLERWLARHS